MAARDALINAKDVERALVVVLAHVHHVEDVQDNARAVVNSVPDAPEVAPMDVLIHVLVAAALHARVDVLINVLADVHPRAKVLRYHVLTHAVPDVLDVLEALMA